MPGAHPAYVVVRSEGRLGHVHQGVVGGFGDLALRAIFGRTLRAKKDAAAILPW